MFNRQEEVSRAIWLDITEVLIYLYSKGIVYNNIKPANIIQNAKARRAKLLNFRLVTKGPNSYGGSTLQYVIPEYQISH